MSVRKRAWRAPDGELKSAWLVDYTDQGGKRRQKTFARRRDADAYHAETTVAVRRGIHTADSVSPTVLEAGKRWLHGRTDAGLERTTLDNYRTILALHIAPHLGATKLSQLTVPIVRAFEDQLRGAYSPSRVRHALGALGAILADAQERGLVAQNVVRSLRRGHDARHQRRQRGRLKTGVDIPSPEEVRALIGQIAERWRPLLLTAIFTGLRSSELRGLRWQDIDFKRGELHVRQRADRLNVIGRPKSESSERTVPLPPTLLQVLREWKLRCPPSSLGLAFPTARGRVLTRHAIVTMGLMPAQVVAGVVTASGAAKYPGMHALRHFYASWCINRRIDGGLELPLKIVQARLGHATIAMTADTYGHLFPRGDDGAEMAAAEKVFFSASGFQLPSHQASAEIS